MSTHERHGVSAPEGHLQELVGRMRVRLFGGKKCQRDFFIKLRSLGLIAAGRLHGYPIRGGLLLPVCFWPALDYRLCTFRQMKINVIPPVVFQEKNFFIIDKKFCLGIIITKSLFSFKLRSLSIKPQKLI